MSVDDYKIFIIGFSLLWFFYLHKRFQNLYHSSFSFSMLQWLYWGKTLNQYDEVIMCVKQSPSSGSITIKIF